MGVTDWNWRLAADPQDTSWDCSANATAWSLRAAGLPYTEADVVRGLGPTRISPAYGLLDATGAGLVSWLAEIGVDAENNPNASWEDLQAAAGYQPMVIGGRNWCHWVAVRMGSDTYNRTVPDSGYQNVDELALMNGAAGYRGVYQSLDRGDFSRLGSFSAVWFNSW
jgi:hypothetical protein